MTRILLLALLALTLAAEDPPKEPPKPDPQQEIAALKQVNENLAKLLNWYKQQFMQMLEREILQPPTASKQEPAK